MKTDIEVEAAFKGRKDLIDILTASAEYLASRDRELDSKAHASWRLWPDPQGRPVIQLALREGGDSFTWNYLPAQLVPADIREFRMLDAWDRVLKHRLDSQVRRTNELIAQLEDS